MIFTAPAKTFLIGEYVATVGGPAIVLATNPTFSLHIDETVTGLKNIHPDSPAGVWYAKQAIKPDGLVFRDPYQGIGGLGASSAQFVLVYKAVKEFQQQAYNYKSLLSDYFRCAWSGEGIRPSGYDVLCQNAQQTLFIDKQGDFQSVLHWPFASYKALLIHTGNKLATHLHLQTQIQPCVEQLKLLAMAAKQAWQDCDFKALCNSVNGYHQTLQSHQLVAVPTVDLIEYFGKQPGVLAAKGCGALGADVLMLLIDETAAESIKNNIEQKGLSLLAEFAISS